MARNKSNPDETVAETVEQPGPAEVPTTFTEDQQNAYARDAQTTDARNLPGYADIHDWYRRTNGGKENAQWRSSRTPSRRRSRPRSNPATAT